jgi:hypothetical protein
MDCRGGGGNEGPSVLLTPENNDDFCMGCIGRAIVFLTKREYRDMAKHERQKRNATQACMHIMAHATKQTKFASYQIPFIKVSKLSHSQYG